MGYFSGVMSKSSTPEQVANDISEKFDSWYGNLSDLRDKSVQYRQAYKGIPNPLPEWAHPDSPNYFVPYMETLVDTIAAKFFLSLFAHDPVIRYNPLDRQSVLATRITERLIHYYLNHRTPGAMTQLFLWVSDAVLQGYGFLYVYWDKNATGKTVAVPIPPEVDAELTDEEANQVATEDQAAPEELVRNEVQETVSYEGFQFSVLDIDDIAADFNEPDLTKTPICVREWINPETYMDRMESMDYEPLTEEQIEGAIQDYRGPSTDEDADTNTPRKKLELIHYYGKGYLNGEDQDKLQDLKVTILRQCSDPEQPNLIVKKLSLGFKPICIIRFKPEKGRLDGRGVGDQTYDLNTELNISFNSRILNTSMALHRMLIIDQRAGIKDKSQLIPRPGGYIECEDINGIKELVHQPMLPEVFQSARETIGYMQDVTAAQDIVQGKANRQELATTATLMDNNAKQRLELHIFRMAKEGLSQLGDLLRTMLIDMYDPNDTLTAILSKDEIDKFGPQLKDANGQQMVDQEGFMEVQVKDLRGAMYADTEISAIDGDKRAVRQEMMQLLQTLMQVIPNGNPTGEMDLQKGTMKVEKINMSKWIKELGRMWGREDTKDLVTTQDVPIPPQMLQAMQQQGGGGQQQPNPPKETPGASVPPPAQEMEAMVQAADQRMATGGE